MTDESLLAAITPRVLLGGFLVVLVLAVGAAAVTSTATLAPYNSDWDGTSTARSTIAAQSSAPPVVVEATAYDRFAGNGTLVVIQAPRDAYTAADIQRVRAFVARGGTVLIAEDRRTATNQLLAQLGVSARLDGRPLRDPQQYYRSPALPVITDTANNSTLRGVDEFTLNRGTVLRSTDGTAIANTSAFAYLDRNGNEQLDSGERFRSYPVASSEQVGSGRVVVVSDSSVFINQMLERPGNQALLTRLLDSHDRVVLDYSHAPGTPPVVVLWLWLHRTVWAQAVLGGFACLAAVMWTHRGVQQRLSTVAAHVVGRFMRSSSMESVVLTSRERVQFLTERHPEWDTERVERIAESMERLNESAALDTDE
ncbi:hypothetical protein GCM10008995_02770 [Halobellus salinus]|uniref:DUF4350 domain-containing protein n=1 Tax=Halobellus salinus TaxID=931585 RepID=A0A830E646_9EURY|nr:DUF4350 domain-containing protein [Halobellus salinus]GGI96135.1 hypothetical protein GCM10008995_02770 [Halobellus salinus]SMP12991.1 hypothetical protein SAMN06265347_104126 [Halobellus salinus]